jgi:hypothetical protein
VAKLCHQQFKMHGNQHLVLNNQHFHLSCFEGNGMVTSTV